MAASEKWEERSYYVVKSNPLVQQARFNLTVTEQKLVIYLISKIRPDATELEPVELSFKDFADICGVQIEGGSYQAYIKQLLMNLRNTARWVRLENGWQAPFSWIDGTPVVTDYGTVIVQLNKLLTPYLVQLREQYTQYKMMYILPMQSKYSVRIYEFLKSYQGLETEIIVPLDALKKLLIAETYDKYKDFRINVLDRAMDEINQYTDISVTYRPVKKGRKVDKIAFDIEPKADLSATFDQLRTALDHDLEVQ